MESILARALEYTLKYWLKSFSRDQFKLQGRTVQLSNLDINGDALHASVGFPPALNVATAKVGKLEIILPSVSYVQVEPIVVQIDKLDLVLEENDDIDPSRSSSSAQASASSAKGSGYGLADKIADGMTLEVGTVNLLLETHGGARQRGGATWASPMASITIRNLLLYTTNESWQVVNLKEARDFSNNKGFIYVFKKLEWESLSIDLLPHPDMFTEAHIASSLDGSTRKDDDGAKRRFFGGERFIEGISGEAYITIQRTELNDPLGLEVQLHITEAVCPALSEPGLRALLRFFTGLYVCLNRGDVNPNAQKRSTEAAGRSLVSIIVDHIFLCIKDADFQLELLMQSLLFSRTSVSDGANTKFLTRMMVGGLFLRDMFSHPPCTLVQPTMHSSGSDTAEIPDFGKNFCPPIYPLGYDKWQLNIGIPLISLHAFQLQPSPTPPSFASKTVIDCQPLTMYLQEESCMRISSFLADGIVAGPGSVLSDFSINSFMFNLKGLVVTVPLEIRKPEYGVKFASGPHGSFAGATLHIENLVFSESPSLKLRLLNLEKDAACFCLWDGQPIDASQKKWTIGASLISLCLEVNSALNGVSCVSSGLWRCVELKGTCLEAAMATADGRPLTTVPPPGGIVRVGVACQQYLSNTSAEQLYFVLDLYSYFGRVSEKIAFVGKNSQPREINEPVSESLLEHAPGDTAVSLALKDLRLRFLEPSSNDFEGLPLVQFVGEDLFIKVSHRTLGGAMAISSSVRWESVEVDCADTQSNSSQENGLVLASSTEHNSPERNGCSELRAVFWVQNKRIYHKNGNYVSVPFLDVRVEHMIPYDVKDAECHSLSVSACVSGIRLGGGMTYAEALLHRFGVLAPDGGPGEGLSKGLEQLSAGPLSKLFKTSPIMDELRESKNNGNLLDNKDINTQSLGVPDDVDVLIELKDWLFALEGPQEISDRWKFCPPEDASREDRCWHTSFQNMIVKAKSRMNYTNGERKYIGEQKYPIELVTVGVEGLKILKPLVHKTIVENGVAGNGHKHNVETHGVNAEIDIVISHDDVDIAMAKWVIDNFKFSVKQPIEAVVTKDELHYLAFLCKSEVESMGRIAAGILRVLKLEGSVGPAAINQLSNLGGEGFDKIFTEKLSRGSSASSIVLNPSSSTTDGSGNLNLESTLTSLDEMVWKAKAACTALTSSLENPDSSLENLANVKQLNQKLESMQKLLMQLRTQI